MTAYRAPDFRERIELSRQTKQKALDRLKAKPAPSEAELAERKAAALKREEAQAARRAARAAEKQAAAEARAAAAKAAAQPAPAPASLFMCESEKKTERDAHKTTHKCRKSRR